jgi:hypothetical protein
MRPKIMILVGEKWAPAGDFAWPGLFFGRNSGMARIFD